MIDQFDGLSEVHEASRLHRTVHKAGQAKVVVHHTMDKHGDTCVSHENAEMSHRQRFAVTFALAAATALFVISVLRSAPRPLEELDRDALITIDFSELKPALADFIAQAQKNETIGRNVSDFPTLWAEALPDDSNDRFRWRKFSLPTTTNLRQENDGKIAAGKGVLYWPMLFIQVDMEESKIVRVVVFMQGL